MEPGGEQVAKKKAAAKQAQSKKLLWVGGGVVALVTLAIGLSIGLNGAKETAPPAVLSTDRKAMGPADAKVVLVEYGDFL